MDQKELILEEQKKRWGSEIVNKASENLERNMNSEFVTLVDEKTGVEKQFKKTVADVLLAKKEKAHSKPRKVFSLPDMSHIKWDN